MGQKWITRIVLFWLAVFLWRYLSRGDHDDYVSIVYTRIENRPYNPGDFVNLGFSLYEFEEAKVRDIEQQQDCDLTGIVLFDKPLPVIRHTVQQLLNLSMFKQIIVWNENPTTKLTVTDLTDHNHSTSSLRIVNAEGTVRHLAKYHACKQAETRACFFIGNNGKVLGSMNSFLASFRSDPTALHLITDSYTCYANVIMTYLNSTVDSYDEPSEVDYGMLFLRDYAHRRLQLLNNSPIHQSDKMMFTSKVNLRPTDDAVAIWLHDTQYSSVEKPNARHVSCIFQRAPHTTQSNTDNPTSRFSYLVKSLSFSQDFICYSNVHLFDTPNEPSHLPESDADRRVVYTTFSNIWRAVDDDLSTCWSSHRNLHAGDFFAIDFLRPRSNVTFTVTFTHDPSLQQNLEIRISFDGVWWIPYRSLKGIHMTMHHGSPRALQTIVFDSAQFNLGFQSFRYLSFHARSRSHQRLHVCNVELLWAGREI